jgi:hypothetical protein
MKLARIALRVLPTLLVLPCVAPRALAACTQTGFVRDNINLTAALINPAGTVSGDVDATGCNIGIYYGAVAPPPPPGPGGPGGPGPGSEMVNMASVHGANYYGIVNNGANVTIQNSTVYDIGETPLNGDQHGVGIYFAFGTKATGNITGNVLWNYQKGGIVVNSLPKVNISNNTVIGQGPVSYIAQNGIQLGYGGEGTISNNLIVGNSYTGAGQTDSAGILYFGGACNGAGTPNSINSTISGNTLVGNDIGIYMSDLDANCNLISTPTNNKALNNIIRDNAVNNTTGDGAGAGYQAGILDNGDQDTIQGNSICGIGYTPVATPPPFLFAIDTTFTNNPILKNNTTCSASGPVTADAATPAIPTAPPPPQPPGHPGMKP